MSGKIIKGLKSDFSVTSTIGEFFRECARRYDSKQCQVDAATGEVESYASVDKRSTRVAIEMQKRGITDKDVIVLCTKMTMDTMIPIVAGFYLGAKVANLDPSLSVRQTTHLLSLVCPKMVFVEKESVELITESLKSANLKADLVVFGESKNHPTFSEFVQPKNEEETFKVTKVDIHETAMIFFSSGTTGLPKAICHSHSSFLNVGHSYLKINANPNAGLSFTSFYWISASLMLFCSYMSGGCRIICDSFDPEKTFTVIEKYKVTFIFLSPLLSYKLTQLEQKRKYDISSLHCIILGGGPLGVEQYKKMCKVFDNARIFLAYGLTEAGVVTSFDAKNEVELSKKKIGSSGKVAVNMEVKVVDLVTEKILGPKHRGEIRIKSPSLLTKYYNADSSQIFDNDGFFKTGDLAYYDEDHCFYVIERLKEMFKYLSWHVVPSAVEAVLLEHQAVRETVVFGTPINEEEGEVPTACIILKDGCKVTKDEIQKFVEERVSDYEKLRGGIYFVDKLQKTPSGKLMRKEIRMEMLKKIGIL